MADSRELAGNRLADRGTGQPFHPTILTVWIEFEENITSISFLDQIDGVKLQAVRIHNSGAPQLILQSLKTNRSRVYTQEPVRGTCQ